MDVTQVVFSFPDDSLNTLDRMTEDAGLSTAQTVRESLRFARLVQKEIADGFTEIVVRNPLSGKERTITAPFID